MHRPDLSRRHFAATLAASALTLRAAPGDWTPLFDGRSLKGWKPSENTRSWKIIDGALAADGPRSHLFYDGPVNAAAFRNFELEVEVMAAREANSGVYFHTVFQEKGFPQKGFEIQVNNTALGEGTYRERKKTGSLYGIRNVYKQLIADNEWFTMNLQVRGKNIQVRLNGTLVVDYTEPTPAVLAEGSERGRVLDAGTFALQCHDPGSKARYRAVRVRPLPDDTPTPDGAVAAEVDEGFQDILNLAAKNYPIVDSHVHLKSGLTLEQALARSRRDGIFYGIAVNCGKGFPVQDDKSLREFLQTMKGQPCFIAMQAEGREWTQMFSQSAAALFDYIFTDSMTWTDNHGKRMRTWIPAEVGTIANPQEFMETLVDRATGILEREPVDIYVNPTFLPDALANGYEKLWTDARMKKVAAAAAKGGVAVEINDRYKLPSASFIRVFKEAGCRFTFGTNNGGPNDLRRCDYGRQMVKECGLRWQDFWTPGAFGPKAVERKGGVLKG